VPDTEWPLLSYAEGPAAEYFQACKVNPSWHPSYRETRLEHNNYHFRQRDWKESDFKTSNVSPLIAASIRSTGRLEAFSCPHANAPKCI
jgi:hypothetical protein